MGSEMCIRDRGTPTNPFNTVNEAINFAWDGARIKIVSGTYPEYVLTDKELFIYAASGNVLIN